MKAIILAGGFGKRLRPLTNEKPKPMIEVYNKPIIAWQVEWLKSNGVDDIIVSAGYKHEKIREYLGNGNRFGVDIQYVIESKPLGTGGGLKNARDMVDDRFIAINGDVLTDLRIDRLLDAINNAIGVLAVVPLPSPFGIIDIDKEDNILGFIEKPKIKDYWINAGVYYLKKDIFDHLPDVGDIERDTFPKLASDRLLKAVRYEDVYWRSIDSHKDIEEASKELEARYNR